MRSTNRRQFMKQWLNWSLRLPALGLLPAVTACAGGERTGRGGEMEPAIREVVSKRLHHTSEGFRNPFSGAEFGNGLRVLHWKLFTRNHFRHLYPQEKVRPVHIDWDPVKSHRGLSVTFIKHSSLMIHDLDRWILIDPIYGGLMPFIKDFSPLAFDPQKFPAPDMVLVTHGHYDHLDKDSLALLDPGTHVVGPLGYDAVFADLGMRNRSRLDWLETVSAGGTRITLLPCNHWTMRNPLIGPNRNLWGAFLIETAAGPTIFVGGDTAYFDGFKELGRMYDIDLAVFNLGAYEPRWFMVHSHMNPAETRQAFRDLGAEKMMVIHWGAFRLGDEPVYMPPLDMKREMEAAGMAERLIHLDPGQTWFA